MKRKATFGKLGIGFALALAGLAGTTQPATLTGRTAQHQHQNQQQQKATPVGVAEKEAHKIHAAGGLDLMQVGQYGMSPKEYGLRFGNGKSRKGKNNYARMSHNAKVQRRA